MADGSAHAPLHVPLVADELKPHTKTPVKTRKFKVDFWATDLNTAEIGIMKRTQNEAASDQFTKDMEIYGQTVVNGKREALIAYRQEMWKRKKDFQRRLVIKLFSEDLHWRGTVEMLVGRSMQLSLGAGGLPVPAYSINLARHDQLIQLERSAHHWPLFPEKYSFFLQTKNGPRFYKLRRNIVCIGADYTLFDQKGRKIGQLDSRIINLGGAWEVTLDKAHAKARLEAVLQLFCAVLKFNGKARRHIRHLTEKVHSGRLVPELDHREEDLYLNPRRRR